MNSKVLRCKKIDEKYILSPRKFFNTFGHLCLNEEILSRNFSKKQLYYFLDEYLTQVPQEMVTYENIATGRVILVGRPNSFNAYLRPPVKQEKTRTNEIEQMNLDELLKKYSASQDDLDSSLYLNEILSRIKKESGKPKKEEPPKVYKKYLYQNIDK